MTTALFLNEKPIFSGRKCGIIMPIAPHPAYPEDHWSDVLSLLTETIAATGFEPRLVSEDDAVGLIHGRIVRNVYHDDMIVCDVSSANPNVMFELGLRLAFDKPVIIIKDEKTPYSFDTGVIEHLAYDSSLRYGQLSPFRKELVRRIGATYAASAEPDYSPFLKSFGGELLQSGREQSDAGNTRSVLEQLEQLRNQIRSLGVHRSDPKYKSGSLRISPQMKQQFLYAILARLKDDYPEMTETQHLGLLQEKAMNSGFEITPEERNNFFKGLNNL